MNKNRKVIPFGYYGGKYSHLNWLLPLLNHNGDERRYVEPFCGSLAVGLNRKKYAARCYANDLDCSVINFFECLRDRRDELIDAIALTPLGRDTWEQGNTDRFMVSDSPIDAARLFHAYISQSFSNMTGSDCNGYGCTPMLNTRDAISNRMNAIADKLQGFRFENRDALTVIKAHSKKGAFMYIDPPYMADNRTCVAYYHDNFDNSHEEMLDVCLNSNAYIAISGYACSLYDDKLKNWNKFEKETTCGGGVNFGGKRNSRTEILWTNYTPKHDIMTKGLFDIKN